MSENIQGGRAFEESGAFGAAFNCYDVAQESADAQERYEGACGKLRIYEMGKAPVNAITIIGRLLLTITILAGATVILLALPSQGATISSDRPLNVFLLSAGIGGGLTGLAWSALVLAAGRILRVVQIMALRQECDRAERLQSACASTSVATKESA